MQHIVAGRTVAPCSPGNRREGDLTVLPSSCPRPALGSGGNKHPNVIVWIHWICGSFSNLWTVLGWSGSSDIELFSSTIASRAARSAESRWATCHPRDPKSTDRVFCMSCAALEFRVTCPGTVSVSPQPSWLYCTVPMGSNSPVRIRIVRTLRSAVSIVDSASSPSATASAQRDDSGKYMEEILYLLHGVRSTARATNGRGSVTCSVVGVERPAV